MNRILYSFLLTIVLGLFLVQPVLASEVFFESESFNNQTGSQFGLNVFLNTQKQSINAFEGSVLFNGDMLDLQTIEDGGNIVNFWINKPKSSNGEIYFSGVTPGGFNGPKGLLFSVVFLIKKPGIMHFDLEGGQFLKNDGLGSRDVITVMPFNKDAFGEGDAAIQEKKDAILPENFTPYIARDQNMFNGKWFLVFSTQDKLSGVDYYQVKEARQKFLLPFSQWIEVESPYVVKDQALKSHIVVKAVDRSQNARIVLIPPRQQLAWYENIIIWIIITLTGALLSATIFWALKKHKTWQEIYIKK